CLLCTVPASTVISTLSLHDALPIYQSSGTVSIETMVAFTEAVASVPGESSSWRQASADISDTTRSGPHCMLTCAMTPSTTTSVTRPAKRLRAELTTPLGSGRDPADDWASAANSRPSTTARFDESLC